MKKSLFFAFALVASVLAFVSCNKDDKKSEEPTQTTVNPADYINTVWRIDSCLAGGAKQRPPHGLIRVLNDKQVVFDNDTTSYAFQDGKLIFRDIEMTIADVKKGWAKLSDRGRDIYLCQLPELDMENQIMPPTAADFVGTWKHAYFTQDSHTIGQPVWYIEASNPWVETWEFKADGTCIYKDYFTGDTQTGTWSYDYGIIFLNNPLEYLLVDANDRITVQPLTKNWFQILRSDGTTSYNWWFYRVK